MSLTNYQVNRLNKMCPMAKETSLGTELDYRLEMVDTTGAPSASAANTKKLFVDATNSKIYFCIDSDTMVELNTT